MEQLLQVVEHLGADAQALREARRAAGHDHELLEVDGVVGVRAAVEHVHHRHGQRGRRLATEVEVERLAGVGGCGLRDGERDAEDGVRAEAALGRRAVEVDERLVEALLIGGVAAGDRASDLVVDVRDGLRDALAEVGGAAVAELRGLELTRRGAGRHRGAGLSTAAQLDVDLDGGVATAVEDLASVDGLDRAHAAPWVGDVGSAVARRRAVVARSASSGSSPRRRAASTKTYRSSPSARNAAVSSSGS